MQRFTAFLCCLALFPFAACETQVDETPRSTDLTRLENVDSASPVYDYVFTAFDDDKRKTKKSLFRPLKADTNDDVRWKAVQNYAISIAPPNIADVRPMVEWEPMKSIVLQWPAGYLTHSQNASKTMLSIATNSATVAEVWIITNPEGEAAIKQALLGHGMTQEVLDAKVKILPTMIDSIWFIDSGPLPIVDKTKNTYSFADFRYYHERPLDDGISTVLGRTLASWGHKNVETYRMPLNTEGGTFQATSDGICFTGTRQLYYMSCAAGGCDPDTGGKPDWHQGGNKYVSMEDSNKHPLAQIMRDVWKEYLGCKDVIITNSVTDDGTGHIDMYLKVLDDSRVMLGQYEAPFEADTRQEENALLQDETAAYLENYVKPDGSKFTVPRLVMPGHRSTNDGMMPFTYINSTFINGLNLWPATEYPEWEESRAQAQAQWEAALPEMEHIWIDSTQLSFWSGAIHCITRTVPDLPEGAWIGEGTCGDGDTCAAPANGYSGECQPHYLSSDVCWGPEWLCDCNNCDTGCSYEPAPYEGDCSDGVDNDGDGTIDCVDVDCLNDADCSGCPEWLSYAGCCMEDVIKYCDGGSRVGYSCEYGCGWSVKGSFYDCADSNNDVVPGAEDPTGDNAMNCSDLQGCDPVCDGKTCGDDGCEGSCGSCGAGEICNAGGTCEAGCEDVCVDGEAGCSDNQTWACVQDEFGCLVQGNFGPCDDCVDNVCVSGGCNNLCSVVGETGCNSTGAWECVANAEGCLVPVVVEECTSCTDGACETTEEEEGGGRGSVGCSSSDGGNSWPLLLLSLGLVALISRRRGLQD